MASARLTALAAVLVTMWLAVSTPLHEGAGVVALIGWVAAAMLAFGLVIGLRGGVSGAAVALVIRIALAASLHVDLNPPIWAQVLLIALTIELASASFTLRSRPADPGLLLARCILTALGACALVQLLALTAARTTASGPLVKVAGVAAVVIAAGWVTRIWRQSGLTG